MTIFFVHIQKTSGTSINTILKSQRKRVWYRRKQENIPDIIIGHYPYGLHKKLKIEDPSYFTFLRDPIERWKSQFNHGITRHKVRSFGFQKFNELDQNLERYLDWCLENDAGCNIMTKQIAGSESLKNIRRWETDLNPYRDFDYYQVYGWAGRINHPNMDIIIKRAEHNLSNHFSFIGFLEKSDIDQKRLCDLYGFKFVSTVQANISKERVYFDWDDDKIKNKLVEINKYDLMLYKYALKMRERNECDTSNRGLAKQVRR